MGSAIGQQSTAWSAVTGTFANSGSLATTYTIPSDAAGQVINIVLTATNTCGATITDTLALTVTSSVTPVFNLPTTLCTGATAPILPTISNNGITGTWSPSVVSNTINGIYVFTPNAGQCATPFTLNVTVTNAITPTFSISNTICTGATAPILPTTSNNGITGTWSPSSISNTANGTYVFTPNAGQCAIPFSITITVTDLVVPTFTLDNTICAGSTAFVLPTTSDNGITGTWNPSVVDNSNDGNYTFTPNNGQCADEFVLNVTVTSFDVKQIQGCKSGEFIISVEPLNNSFDPANVTYTWKNSANTVVGMNENQLNISQLLNAGTIQFPATFNVTISDNTGCSTKVDIVVQGAFCNIPKGISPNNDGDNDSFDLTGMGIKEIFIYNRYGTEIYNQKNYTDQWRGQSKEGHELPSGTYFYVIYKNNNETNTGWVYITRG